MTASNNKHDSSAEFVYEEFSYQLIGIVFKVERSMGYGYRESQYQRAIKLECEKQGLECERELPVKIMYQGDYITTNYMDLLVRKDDKEVVIEVKQGSYFNKQDIDQLYNYLCAADLKLGLLIRFTRRGVRIKRIVNIR